MCCIALAWISDMRIGLIAMSGVRVKSAELAALGVTLPGFVNRGKVIASLPSLGLLTVAALTRPSMKSPTSKFKSSLGLRLNRTSIWLEFPQ
jgi:hypothetical protein